MKKIFKYELKITGIQYISMPQGSEILCIQTQHNSPCIWALVDPIAESINRKFETVGTGYNVTEIEKSKYIGTYQIDGGALVFHVFELFGK